MYFLTAALNVVLSFLRTVMYILWHSYRCTNC